MFKVQTIQEENPVQSNINIFHEIKKKSVTEPAYSSKITCITELIFAKQKR